MTEPPSGAWTPPPASPPPYPGAPPPQQPWGSPPPGGPWPGGAPYPPPKPTSSLAVVSLVFGIVQFFVCPIIGGIVAIVTGHVARGRAKRSQGAEGGTGMALAGVILGYAGIALTIIVGIGAVVLFAVYGDDIERISLRDEAHAFIDEAQAEAVITGPAVRDPAVLSRAYETVDLDGSYQSMTLPDGTPIPIADASDWERARWRVELSSSLFGDTTYICVEIPETTTADPRITNGRCDVVAAA
ncbi:MAG: DUF4190 domain-containing protein [Acidimicrobiia bacterium]